MKLSRKNMGALLGMLALSCVVGTLMWEVLERLAGAAGLPMDLSVGPLSVDLHAIAVSIRANPGSLLGMAGGAVLFRAL